MARFSSRPETKTWNIFLARSQHTQVVELSTLTGDAFIEQDSILGHKVDKYILRRERSIVFAQLMSLAIVVKIEQKSCVNASLSSMHRSWKII